VCVCVKQQGCFGGQQTSLADKDVDNTHSPTYASIHTDTVTRPSQNSAWQQMGLVVYRLDILLCGES